MGSRGVGMLQHELRDQRRLADTADPPYHHWGAAGHCPHYRPLDAGTLARPGFCADLADVAAQFVDLLLPPVKPVLKFIAGRPAGHSLELSQKATQLDLAVEFIND